MPQPPTIEIAYAPAAQVFRANPRDPTPLNTPFGVLKQQEGMVNVYYGLQHEDQCTAYVFVAWETLEHHYKLMNDPETYPKLTGSAHVMLDTSETPLTMIHARPAAFPYKALDAPVLELCTFTLKPGQSQSKPALEQLADEATRTFNSLPASDGLVYVTWGTVVEKPDAIVFFVGWTSVEAHVAFAATNEAFKAFRERARVLADIEAKHIPLTLF